MTPASWTCCSASARGPIGHRYSEGWRRWRRGRDARRAFDAIRATLSFPAKAGNPVRRGLSVFLTASGILDHPLSRVMTLPCGASTPPLNSEHPSLPHQPVRKIPDRLAIDHRPIPLPHRLEIGGAFAIGLAHLEAVGVEQVRSRGEHVGDAVAEVDVAVAVEIDAVFDVGRRQELGLADLAGIGADEVAQRQVAALHNLERSEQLALEQLGAAAIMRQRCQRADHRQLADVALAEIALQSPDRDQYLPGHAELLLDAREQRGMTLQQRTPAIDAAGADAGRDVLLKTLVEGVALTPVEGEHGAVLGDPAERRAGHTHRDAGSLRFRGHAGDKAVEVAAAARGLGLAAGQRENEGGGQA